nr:S9 family peptidase [Gemmatimonadota bacterium]NIR73832.1 S9 family peptidase [Candidatus Kutchimonas denitrificans]NIS02477.1 S9 family peptidase [Gemmatimonadota bacterium]NIT68345.1 S9 family peptidase [Gemmatimonadota bacterium]NIU51612.1 S9 family peptidase [Gemmatimonadota bacterium]
MSVRKLIGTALVGVLGLALVPPTVLGQIDYPETRKVDHVDIYHGTVVPDPYRWLEDTNSEETAAWVEAQNEVTFAYLEAIPERDWIRERLTELWDYERYRTPWKDGGRYFYSKNDGLQNQSVYYTLTSLDAEPEVVLDPNKLSEDGTVSAYPLDVSEDGKYMVYGVATSGSDWREFYIREVETRKDLDDHLEWIKFSGASWTHDGAGFFYSRYPEPTEGDTYEEANRNQKLYYHRAGTPQSDDQLIYERPDQPEWGFGMSITDDGRYGIMGVWHGTDERNRVYYVDFGDPMDPKLDGEVVELLDDFDASYNFIGNDGPVFYFVTNLDAPKYRLIAIDTRSPARDNWREIIPEKEDVLQSVGIVNEQFVARYMHDAHTQVVILNKDGSLDTEVELPTIGSAGGFSGEREDSEAFYSFTSFLYPTTIFRYDFETGESTVFRAPDVDFDPSGYETKQVFYPSKDGTMIPMFLTHKKGIALDGSNPTYLYGYGGFNISRTPGFSTSMLVWLEMGGIYASANLRGGGEYGE